MTIKKIIPCLLLLSVALSGCNLFANVPPGLSATATSIGLPLPSATPLVLSATPPPSTLTPTAAPTSTETQTPTAAATSTETQTPTPAQSLTPSVTPTYAVLRGTVNVEKVSCRYGPGPDYLYMYGLRRGPTRM